MDEPIPVRVILRIPWKRPAGYQHPQREPRQDYWTDDREKKLSELNILFTRDQLNRSPGSSLKPLEERFQRLQTSGGGVSGGLRRSQGGLVSSEELSSLVKQYDFDWSLIGRQLGLDPQEARSRYFEKMRDKSNTTLGQSGDVRFLRSRPEAPRLLDLSSGFSEPNLSNSDSSAISDDDITRSELADAMLDKASKLDFSDEDN